MISAQCGTCESHLGLGGARGVEGSCNKIAEVGSQIGGCRTDIGNHGLKGQKVSVYVSDDCNAYKFETISHRSGSVIKGLSEQGFARGTWALPRAGSEARGNGNFNLT